MLFRIVDKFIDKKVGNAFSYFRKLGRRTERAYYTTYQDWLVYTSRRSHDNSVKITMAIVIGCCFHLVLTFQTFFLYLTSFRHITVNNLESNLIEFNKTRKVTEKDPMDMFVSVKLKLKGHDDYVYSAMQEGRDK